MMIKLKATLRNVARHYVRFVEKQGFTVILGVCVAVITATALWTKQSSVSAPDPTPPYEASLSVAELLQQSLADAATPSPAPTVAPQSFSPPLEQVSVLTPFNNARMRPSGVTGVWRLHDAIDLAGQTGEPVRAMSDGIVVSITEGGVEGACAVIAHSPSLIAEYSGMAALSGVKAGDPVEAGQTLGFLGRGMLDESDLPAHLHLRVTRNNQAVDPSLLWK